MKATTLARIIVGATLVLAPSALPAQVAGKQARR